MQKVFAIGMIGLLSTSAYAAKETIWYGVGGNAGHTGYLSTTSDASKFKILWSKQFTDPNLANSNTRMMDMSVTGDKIYLSISRVNQNNDNPYQGMFALNAQTGEQIWHHPIPSDMDLVSAPALNGGLLYYNMNNSRTTHDKYRGYLKAYAADGSAVFSRSISFNSGIASLSTPTAFNGFVYTKDFSQVYEVDGVSGNLARTYDMPHNDSQLVITRDYYLSTLYSDFNMVDYFTGKSAYHIATPGQVADSAYANIIYDDKSNTAFAVFYNVETDDTATLFALDVSKHEITWSYPLGKMAHQPAFADNTIYIVSDQTMQAINAQTGKLKWHWTLDRSITAETYDSFSAVITSNHIFISGSGYTFAINRKTHAKDWELNQSGKLMLNNKELLMLNDYHNPGYVTAISIN